MFKLADMDLGDFAEEVDLEAKKAAGRNGRGELPRSFFETYSAMANTNGGIILLGIEEKPKGIFTAIGIAEPDPVLKSLWDGLNNRNQVSINLLADQMVEVLDYQGKNVIQVSVPRARRNQRPVYKGANPFEGTYRRNYEGDYLCDYETVRRIIADKGEDSRDATLLENFDFEDLDEATLRAYRNQFKATRPDHPWLDLDDLEFLRSIGGWNLDRDTKREGLTLAGLLMFGRLRSILDAVPNYVVDYQERPKDANETRWTDRITTDGTWSGNLYDFYRLAIQRLFRDLKVPFKLDEMRRVDDTPVHEALREALINTLIHADYSGRTPVLVVKGPDMFLFRNPGTMRLSLDDVLRGGMSDCRNRNLQKMFQLIGHGEQAGSGVPRIYRNWKQQLWRSPDLSERFDPDLTQLTLRMVSLIPEEVILELDGRFEASFRRLSELQRLALATAVIEGSVTHARLKSMTSAHPHDITMALSALVKEGFLDSYGATRGTFYVLVGESPPAEEDLLRQRRVQLLVPLKPEQAGKDSEYSSIPLEESSVPLEESSVPLEESSVPLEESSIPLEESSIPLEESSVPLEESSIPLEESSIPLEESSIPLEESSVPLEESSVPSEESSVPSEMSPDHLERLLLIALPVRERSRVTRDAMVRTILAVCNDDFLNLRDLAYLLKRSSEYLRIRYLNQMVREGQLELKYPDRPTHPDQGYGVKKDNFSQKSRI